MSDAYSYGYGKIRDFVERPPEPDSFDWVITNPPFRLAEDFLMLSLKIARVGVAILARTVFLESAGRYNTIFQTTPPSKFAQFVERVPWSGGAWMTKHLRLLDMHGSFGRSACPRLRRI